MGNTKEIKAVRVILFAFLIMLQVASVGEAQEDNPFFEFSMIRAETATKVMRGKLLYKSKYIGAYNSLIYYYAHDLNVYACYFENRFKRLGSPLAVCQDQVDTAKSLYPDRFKALEPYLRLPALVLSSESEKQIGDQEFNGRIWTFHSTETNLFMCSVQVTFLVCKENTDATKLDFDIF